MQAIRELHYLDAGLNCRGAYLTDPRMVSNLSRLAKPPAVHLHGTPRQWGEHPLGDGFGLLRQSAAC